ncbi:MAG: hypothetical protein GY754_35430 [bacterium]|nr:hypothetical protein [bacterium]
MLEIGTIPIDFTLDQYNSGTDTLSNYSGKIISLSFMDIDNDWDWLKNLISIKNNASFTSNMQIIAVIYKYNGSTSKDDIQEKIDNDPDITDTDIDFPLLVDNTWSTICFAYQYLNQGFGDDDYFSDSFSNYLSSFLISKDYVISDKWNKNCTTNSDPISFNKIIIPSIAVFDSLDYDNTEEYLLPRLINLDASPTILYTTPSEESELTDLTQVEIVYSKLMEDEAGTAANYTPGGTGAGALSVTEASYTGTERIENAATLSTEGTLEDGELSITLSGAITDTEGNSLDNSVINYTINPNAPSITSWTEAGTIADGNIIQVTFSEDVSNATEAGNYNVNYSGTGTVTILEPIVYNSGTRTAELTISLFETNGATFTINTVTGSNPISDGTHTLANSTSNLYSTADLLAPTVSSWTVSGTVNDGDVITVKFSENVVNTNNINNYQVNYSGTGTVSITQPISYNDTEHTAALTMSISGTDGKTFTIETITGTSPISDGTNNLVNGISNTYLTSDEVAPTIISWSDPGVINNDDTITITFSENVINADNINNYSINYSGSGSVTINDSISYNSDTFTASLPLSLSGTDGSTFTIETVLGSSPISDNTTPLINGTSPTYTSAVVVVPKPSISIIAKNDILGNVYDTVIENGGTFDMGKIRLGDCINDYIFIFNIHNNGAEDLEVTDILINWIENRGSFDFCYIPDLPATITDSTSVHFDTSFAPSEPESAKVEITIKSNDPEKENFTFTILAQCVAEQTIEVTAVKDVTGKVFNTVIPNGGYFDMGAIPKSVIIDDYIFDFSIKNTGGESIIFPEYTTLTISDLELKILSGSGLDFYPYPDLPASLNYNESITFGTSYVNASSTEELRAEITISNNDPLNENFIFTISVRCEDI